MACELVLASSFPELQQGLLERITRLCEANPLVTKRVLTPTTAVAEHLKLELSRWSGDSVLAGVQVLPFSQMLAASLRRAGMPHLPRYHPTLDLLLVNLVKRLGSNVIPELRDSEINCTTLHPTFLDLADGGFGSEQVPLIFEIAEEEDLSRIERTVLKLYAGWVQALEASELGWEPLGLQLLSEWLEELPGLEMRNLLGLGSGCESATLLVHGFYDFTDVNLQFLSVLAKRTNLVIYYPHQERHPAFSFARAVLRDLSSRLGNAIVKRTILPDTPASSPARFFLQSFPKGEVGDQPAFLSIQQASGIRAEALSAAVRIREWLDNGSASLNRILLLVPDLELYCSEVQEVFAAFSFPLRVVGRPRLRGPEDQSLFLLKRIWETRGQVEWILTLFREYPVLLIRRGIDLEDLENRIRRLPIADGGAWVRLLEAFREGGGELKPGFTEEEIKLIDEIVELWVERPDSGYEIDEAVRILGQIGERWVEHPEDLAAVLEAVVTSGQLLPDAKVSEEMLGLLLGSQGGQSSHSDPMDQPGVLLASIMGARGLTADALVILGLSLDRFPPKVDEDPLLSDASRGRLIRKAREVGHRLAVKSRILDEMSLLFLLTNTSAKQVHWVIPNTDESGKKVAPTPWVQRYHHRWRKKDVDVAWCQSAIPRGPAEQASFLYHLDPEDGGFLAPQYAALLRGCKLDELLEQQSDVSECRQEHYGWVRPAAISKNHRPMSFSVTELEFLAKCPYRFYAQSVAGWNAIRPQLFSIEPDALEWGRLVHSHLESLLAPIQDRSSLLSSVLTTRLEGLEEDLLITRIVESLPFPLRLLPGPLQKSAARRLVLLAKAYHAAIGESCDEARPVFRELKIRLPFPGREYLTISGQIDRVDDRDGEAHVVDYKSGVFPWANRKQQLLEISLGFRLQPLIYPWLYQQRERLSRAPGFSFVFLGEVPPREVAVSSRETLEELLSSLLVLLERGLFPATPDELMARWGLGEARPCSFCDFTSLCRRFDEVVQTQHKAHLERDGHERMTLLARAARSVE